MQNHQQLFPTLATHRCLSHRLKVRFRTLQMFLTVVTGCCILLAVHGSAFAQDGSRVFLPSVHNGSVTENAETNDEGAEIDPPSFSIVETLNLPKQTNKVGQYYHQYIYPYLGVYGAGSADQVNHFYPLMGNHDYGHGSGTDIPLIDCVAGVGLNACSQDQGDWYDYFTLPGNERTYSVKEGAVELFLFSDYYRDADWAYNENNNMALQIVKNGLLNSTATWKVVLLHFPPYVSASGVNFGADNNRRFDFEGWGADASTPTVRRLISNISRAMA